jgi:bacillithiol biosynthesis cysteine-adding enzyme BshC
MACVSIPFRRLPHQPKLFIRFLDDPKSLKAFYPHPPTLDAVKQVAQNLDFPAERRREVAAALRDQNAAFGGGSAVMSNLDELERGAVAVVSGQQVGLFGGPAYAFYKALTAIQIAQELRRDGIAAVPVFWMATEDHDLDEVRHVSWFDAGRLIRFELPAGPTPAPPVGNVRLGDVEKMVEQATALLSGPSSETVAQAFRESYQPGETYGSAFGKLFARLFAEQGLILLDPLDPRLHRVAEPIYRRALEHRDELNEKLLQRGQDLAEAGFEPQVKVTARSTLLFSLQGGVRLPITAGNGKFKSGDTSWSREETLRLVHDQPENFSPNALLRPVVQDHLLPTVADVGGPAEISYLAQSEVIYRNLLGRMPVLLPRADFTLLDAKAEKLLQKYQLCIENIWEGPQELRRRIEAIALPAKLSRDFELKKSQIDSTLEKLGGDIEKLDPSLAGAVRTAISKMKFQLESLQRKTARALDEKDGLITGHVEFLEALLYPNKATQSRELCFPPFLARWGMNGLKELQELAGSQNLKEHRIVRIT